MKSLKDLFPIFLSLALVLSFSVRPLNGESSKSSKRYRSKQVSKLGVNSFSPMENHTTTDDHQIYPSPTISSSRAMPVSGLASDFDTEREEELLQPFNPDYNQWGNHRLISSSGSSSSGGASQKQSSSQKDNSGSSSSSSSSSSYPHPPISQRYTAQSAEKFEKYINHHNNNFGLGSATSGQQIYTSYPLGAGGSSYHAGNPLLDSYPFYERERAARDLLLNAATVSKLNALNSLGVGVNPAIAAAAASSILGNAVAPPVDFDGYGDALALASGHGGHGGGGWGWGWKEPEHHGHGHDHGHHDHGYNSHVNTNAIGLLGLLGLLSLLSNVILLLTTTTTTAAGRRKRSLEPSPFELQEESEEAKRQRIFYEVLPYLSPVAHARNGLIPSECTLTGVCLVNKVIVKEYGLTGRPAGNRVTAAIARLLGEVDTSEGQSKKIEMAGLHGRNQRNCQKVYPVCSSLQTDGPHTVPFKIRMEQVPLLFEQLKKKTSYSPMNL
ncbi:uncharacterized protein LOC118436609 isoform X1 [Folsomia candida]|uniref:uncharacterized protein LOC118436609 isoform X1 n=1 Tax=Folsomia candida TaxID=158441 RepID=UPI00160503CD|nr:uncharacterized protein LOC118436609 isoform X1 [Folsomia candida]